MRLTDLRQYFSRSRPLTSEAALLGGMATRAECVAMHSAIATAPVAATPWPQSRLGLVERLWGEGHVLPGGDEEIMRLATPLGLSTASTVLLLGAGLGGPARVIARDLGAWVNGLEAEHRLAAIAADRLARAGRDVSKRASVATWDPEAPTLKRHGFHHAVALDPIAGAQHAPVIAGLAQALKPGGQLVLVQLACDEPLNPHDPALEAWASLEHRTIALPRWADISQSMVKHGFDVRVFEDISARHMRLAMQGWISVVRGLKTERPCPEDAAALVREVELWMRRIRLMRAGSIRLLRWHAIARVGATPGF